MTIWGLIFGFVLIRAGAFELYRVRKYMHYLKTDAGSQTSAFALQAVWSSTAVAVIAMIGGLGLIAMVLTGTI